MPKVSNFSCLSKVNMINSVRMQITRFDSGPESMTKAKVLYDKLRALGNAN